MASVVHREPCAFVLLACKLASHAYVWFVSPWGVWCSSESQRLVWKTTSVQEVTGKIQNICEQNQETVQSQAVSSVNADYQLVEIPRPWFSSSMAWVSYQASLGLISFRID